MAGKIPTQFIDDLLSRVDIVDVISSRVPLKKAGAEYKACCPFHDEKSPSFTVSQTKQFFHCFGCGAHGTAVGFLMDYDRLGFPEAIEALAESIGIDVPREAGMPSGPDHGPLFNILEVAALYFSQQLREHRDAARATGYLKERGLSGEVASRFRMGFAPPGWNNLLQQLGDNEEAITKLNTVGLIQDKDGRRYDRLRDRIIFPIRDTRGRVIGFGGRMLEQDAAQGGAKYLNSPETPVFHKGRELYGLYEARQANKQLSRILVVEGYMDVVALAQFDINYTVATLGTATTSDHLEKLYKNSPEVVFCFDGDRAGRDAAWKALETSLPLMRDGRQARFLFLPDGEDPDTLVRKEGKEAFEARLASAVPLSEFLLNKLSEQVDMDTIDGRARLAELARPHINRLPSGIFRNMMAEKLAETVGARDVGIEKTATSARRHRPTSQPGTIPPVRRAIALVLQSPEIAQLAGLPTGWETQETPGIPILTELLNILQDQPDLSTAALIERWPDPETRRHLAKLTALDLATLDDAGEQFKGTLALLVRQATLDSRKAVNSHQRPSSLTDEQKQRLRALYSRKDRQK